MIFDRNKRETILWTTQGAVVWLVVTDSHGTVIDVCVLRRATDPVSHSIRRGQALWPQGSVNADSVNADSVSR